MDQLSGRSIPRQKLSGHQSRSTLPTWTDDRSVLLRVLRKQRLHRHKIDKIEVFVYGNVRLGRTDIDLNLHAN